MDFYPSSLFALSVAFSVVYSSVRKLTRLQAASMTSLGTLSSNELIEELERRVQLDEGKRGIKPLIIPGEMLKSAKSLLQAKSIVIITGFPCLLDYDPPTETDGPLGAAAIARALLALGKSVTIATDECNEQVILACFARSGMLTKDYAYSGESLNQSKLKLESFPGKDDFDEKDMERLFSLHSSVDCVVAIERAGPAFDGHYRTMRGREMTHLIAPLELLLDKADEDNESISNEKDALSIKLPVSIGIGDGGNEVGMGKIYDEILECGTIPNSKEIACVTASDHLIVSSVSNWAGYGLAAAIAVLSSKSLYNEKSWNREIAVKMCLPSDEEETEMLKGIVAVGAKDGIGGILKPFGVDGFSLEENLEVLRDLRKIALGGFEPRS